MEILIYFKISTIIDTPVGVLTLVDERAEEKKLITYAFLVLAILHVAGLCVRARKVPGGIGIQGRG